MFNKSFQFCNEVIGCDKKNIYIYIPVIDFSVELIPTLFHILSPKKIFCKRPCRIVLSPGEVEEITHILSTTTLKEGEMWGHDVANINRWVDGEGKLIVKFIILYIVL